MFKGFNGYFAKNSPITTGTASSGAVTINGVLVKATSEALTTAAGAEYTLTLTNSSIGTGSIVFASAGLGTATTGTPWIWGVTVANGSATITVTNLHASAAFNGTITISAIVYNPK